MLAYDLNETSGIYLKLQEEYGFIKVKISYLQNNTIVQFKVKSVDLLFDYLAPALPRRWRHFCVVYDEEKQSASVFQVSILYGKGAFP